MSRTAIQAWPVALAPGSWLPKAKQRHDRQDEKILLARRFEDIPRMTNFCAEMTPDDESFDNHGNLVRHQTIKNWAARVATAK